MGEPSLRSSRRALAGGIAALILFGGGGFLLGRGTTERSPLPAAAPPIAAPAPQPVPEPATSRGVLGRADLIALAASAADAVAAGRDPGTEIREADGRRFELRLPFGCGGPASAGSTAAMRWRYDAAASALRVHAAPVVWPASDWWSAAPPAGIDTVEGFWIMRPWTASEDCPPGDDRPVASGADAVTLPGQTLALGQISAGEDSRGGRRDGQAYEAVVRVPRGDLDTSQGFRIRISGRIARMPGGSPVRCRQPAGAEQRPICLVGAVLDEVAIENPATAETLATWTVPQRDAR